MLASLTNRLEFATSVSSPFQLLVFGSWLQTSHHFTPGGFRVSSKGRDLLLPGHNTMITPKSLTSAKIIPHIKFLLKFSQLSPFCCVRKQGCLVRMARTCQMDTRWPNLEQFERTKELWQYWTPAHWIIKWPMKPDQYEKRGQEGKCYTEQCRLKNRRNDTIRKMTIFQSPRQ